MRFTFKDKHASSFSGTDDEGGDSNSDDDDDKNKTGRTASTY
jgi:hypothetical protein